MGPPSRSRERKNRAGRKAWPSGGNLCHRHSLSICSTVARYSKALPQRASCRSRPRSSSQGLAPLIVREVFRIVAQMRDEGISVLLVEQNARMSLEIADYAYVLDNGSIVYVGPVRELAAV